MTFKINMNYYWDLLTLACVFHLTQICQVIFGYDIKS